MIDKIEIVRPQALAVLSNAGHSQDDLQACLSEAIDLFVVKGGDVERIALVEATVSPRGFTFVFNVR